MRACCRLKLLVRLDWEAHHLKIHLVWLHLREASLDPLGRLVSTALILNNLRLWLLCVN